MAQIPEKIVKLDPHAGRQGRHATLEASIGRQVRAFRKKLDVTVTELARQAEVSSGMLSKIENGLTSPSLATLQSLSTALNVPVTAFFRQFEEQRDATFVAAGQGLKIERRGTRNGHLYQLLGHSFGKNVAMEPYIVTLTERSEVFPLFQHNGNELIYVLEGKMDYHHSGASYRLTPGDSLFFDANAAHGPENLIDLPVRFLSVIAYGRAADEDG
jgi:transcriptional regulator with XRE-family HTH domain